MNEIPLGIHDLLQAGPHPAAGVDHGLPVEFGEHLHDRVDEGLLSIMRGPVSVPLSHAQHKKSPGDSDLASYRAIHTPKEYGI